MEIFAISENGMFGCRYVPRKKELISTLIGAGLSVASSIIGGISSASQNRKAKREAERQYARDKAWYNKNYYTDGNDDEIGIQANTAADAYADRQLKRAKGAAAVTGDREVIARTQESNNDFKAKVMANNSARNVAQRNAAEAQMRNDEKTYSQQMMNYSRQKANNIANVASSASNALMAAGSAFDESNSASTAPNTGEVEDTNKASVNTGTSKEIDANNGTTNDDYQPGSDEEYDDDEAFIYDINAQ